MARRSVDVCYLEEDSSCVLLRADKFFTAVVFHNACSYTLA